MELLRADDPRRIGGYRLLGRLGVGGMGRVYLARSSRGRTVAVKLVRAELVEQEEFRTRFRREVNAARRVGGAWTAPVLDADTEAEIPWVATGYVAGPSLEQVVAKDYGPLPESSVWVLAAGLAHALADIHAAGLVHRDLKPSNVMITIDGPRVIDFGIARALETVVGGTVTSTGAMVGSPAFMSPEQVRGDRVTPACDVFCLGSVLAYAATGHKPFGAAGSGVHAQMFRIVQEPPSLDTVPERLRALVADCLAKDPADRPPLDAVLRRIEAVTGPIAPDGRVTGGAGADDGGIAGGTADGAREASAEPWLPGAVVAQLGRQAVWLLELESAETGSLPVVAPAPPAEPPVEEHPSNVPAAPTPPPGAQPEPPTPTTMSAQSQNPAPAAAAAVPAPAPVPDAPTAVAPAARMPAGAPYGPPPALRSPYSPQPGARSPYGPPPGGPAPQPGYAGPVPPAPKPPRRRGGPVAALVVLAVLAAGAAAYVGTERGHRSHRADPTPTTSAPRTATPTGTPAGPTTGPTTQPTEPGGPVPPGAMVGTWKATFDTGAVPGANTRILDVRPDGQVVLTGDGPSYTCTWTMHVTSDDAEVALSPSTVTSGEPPTSCQPGEATTLVLVDPTHLRRDTADAGRSPLTYEKIG